MLNAIGMAHMRARGLEARIRASANLVEMHAVPARAERARREFQIDQHPAGALPQRDRSDWFGIKAQNRRAGWRRGGREREQRGGRRRGRGMGVVLRGG